MPQSHHVPRHPDVCPSNVKPATSGDTVQGPGLHADSPVMARGMAAVPYGRLIRQLEVCGAELDRLRELPQSDEVTDMIQCLEAGYVRMCEALASWPT